MTHISTTSTNFNQSLSLSKLLTSISATNTPLQSIAQDHQDSYRDFFAQWYVHFLFNAFFPFNGVLDEHLVKGPTARTPLQLVLVLDQLQLRTLRMLSSLPPITPDESYDLSPTDLTLVQYDLCNYMAHQSQLRQHCYLELLIYALQDKKPKAAMHNLWE